MFQRIRGWQLSQSTDFKTLASMASLARVTLLPGSSGINVVSKFKWGTEEGKREWERERKVRAGTRHEREGEKELGENGTCVSARCNCAQSHPSASFLFLSPLFRVCLFSFIHTLTILFTVKSSSSSGRVIDAPFTIQVYFDLSPPSVTFSLSLFSHLPSLLCAFSFHSLTS